MNGGLDMIAGGVEMVELKNATDRASVPVLDFDFFQEETLRSPYSLYETLRELGPAIYVPRYDVYIVSRYADVQTVMKDWERFTSTGGTGLSDVRKPGSWRVQPSISIVDPPDHTIFRTIMNRIISPLVVRGWTETFLREGEKVVEEALAKGTFDAVQEIAETFVLKVFYPVLGVNITREQATILGELSFNSIGPQNAMYQRSAEKAAPLMEWWQRNQQREALTPGGWGEQLFQAEDAGEVPQGTASGLMMSLTRGGTDTTISVIGSALRLLAKNGDQWQKLRADPSRARAVFEEAMRCESPLQSMFRTTRGPVELSGAMLEPDRKVHMLLGSANRDPRKWPEPDRFDISRNTGGHLALGFGVHNCVGQMIARLEAEAVLKPFAERVASFELLEEPMYRVNNSLRTLDSLRMKVKLN
jgi:4-methoxybenzoate monooxygenase (O-demethylating)